MFKIKACLSSKKGDILGYIVTAPFILYVILYLILGGAYLLKINEMSTIANKKLDRALVSGQFTDQIKAELITELEEKGFKQENLTIEVTPTDADDSNDVTRVMRGDEIQIKILYTKPHWFYYINEFVNSSIDEKLFYIGTKISGMSEFQ